jgi:hypothetical protein
MKSFRSLPTYYRTPHKLQARLTRPLLKNYVLKQYYILIEGTDKRTQAMSHKYKPSQLHEIKYAAS